MQTTTLALLTSIVWPEFDDLCFDLLTYVRATAKNTIDVKSCDRFSSGRSECPETFIFSNVTFALRRRWTYQ